MVYGADKIVQMPVMQLYDTGLMQAAINNARYMYEKAEKRMDDFYEKYGDFMSPFQKDMERYNQIVGGVRDVINNLYASGEDPLRTASGRAKMAAAMRQINPGEIANMRTNAKLGFEYLKNIEEAKAKDQFSQEFEDYLLTHGGPGAFSDFSSAGGRIWNRPGPGRYQTVDDLIEPIVKNVDYTFDEAMTKQHNDGNNYYSITKDRLAKAIDDNMSDILATQSGGFHYWKAMEAAKALGGDEEMGKQIFKNTISNRLSDHEKVKFEADPFRLDDYRTKNDIRAHRAKAAIDYEYKHKDDPSPTDTTEEGYSLLKDVYVTTLAKGAGLEYLPQGGVDVNQLPQLLKAAEKRQRAAIVSGKNVLDATGQFISPDKINGIIPSAGKSGRGHFLSPEAIQMLRTEDAVRTSFKGWSQKGNPNNSGAVKTYRNNTSKQIADALSNVNGKKGFYVKAVPTVDKNGNNIYSMIGDDNKWHTYARVKIYLSDGNKTTPQTLVESKTGAKGVKMEKDGIELLLPIGLESNEGKASPDLSISAREKVGIKPYNTVKGWVGKDQDADFPWGTNLIKNTTSL